MRLIQFLVALTGCGLWHASTPAARGGEPAPPVRVSSGQEVSPLPLLPLRQVRIDDRFWAPKLRVYKERSVPHSWQYVEGEIRALRRAAGESVTGEPNGTWGEANLYKVLETVAYALALFPDQELEQRMDELLQGRNPRSCQACSMVRRKKGRRRSPGSARKVNSCSSRSYCGCR